MDDGEPIVDLCLPHACGNENILAHEIDILRARCTFYYAPDQRVSLRRVVKRLAGLGQKRFVLEEVEASLNRIDEVLRVSDFEIIRPPLVVASAGEMSQALPRADRPRFLRECRAIFLDGPIKIELTALLELHGGRGSQGLRDRRQPVERGLAGGGVVFDVGEAEAAGPD